MANINLILSTITYKQNIIKNKIEEHLQNFKELYLYLGLYLELFKIPNEINDEYLLIFISQTENVINFITLKTLQYRTVSKIIPNKIIRNKDRSKLKTF